jgi:hypothetical protein
MLCWRIVHPAPLLFAFVSALPVANADRNPLRRQHKKTRHNTRVNKKRSVNMPDGPEQRLLPPLLDSWNRNDTVLLNLLRALPEGALEVRAIAGSPFG